MTSGVFSREMIGSDVTCNVLRAVKAPESGSPGHFPPAEVTSSLQQHNQGRIIMEDNVRDKLWRPLTSLTSSATVLNRKEATAVRPEIVLSGDRNRICFDDPK